jgi:hypothetical protein
LCCPQPGDRQVRQRSSYDECSRLDAAAATGRRATAVMACGRRPRCPPPPPAAACQGGVGQVAVQLTPASARRCVHRQQWPGHPCGSPRRSSPRALSCPSPAPAARRPPPPSRSTLGAQPPPARRACTLCGAAPAREAYGAARRWRARPTRSASRGARRRSGRARRRRKKGTLRERCARGVRLGL